MAAAARPHSGDAMKCQRTIACLFRGDGAGIEGALTC
jgi:hypothetical protein